MFSTKRDWLVLTQAGLFYIWRLITVTLSQLVQNTVVTNSLNETETANPRIYPIKISGGFVRGPLHLFMQTSHKNNHTEK